MDNFLSVVHRPINVNPQGGRVGGGFAHEIDIQGFSWVKTLKIHSAPIIWLSEEKLL